MEKKSLENIGLNIIGHIERAKDRLLKAFKNKIELQRRGARDYDIEVVDAYLSKYSHRIVSLLESFLYHIQVKDPFINKNLTECTRILNNTHPTEHDLLHLSNTILPLIIFLREEVLGIKETKGSSINQNYAEVIRRLKDNNPH